MGYFSNLAIDLQEDFDDDYEVNRLLERLEELKDRLEELYVTGPGRRARNYILDSDLRYVLPEHIGTINGVERAIFLAKKDLEENCGLLILEGEDLEFDVAGRIREAISHNEDGRREEMQIAGQMSLDMYLEDNKLAA